jgi:hypothetical protein
MNSVQIEQKSYEMPPREGMSIAHFLTVADVERSARYYEKVFGARILSLGDGNAPPYLQLANIWMILNVGGGPTPGGPVVPFKIMQVSSWPAGWLSIHVTNKHLGTEDIV